MARERRERRIGDTEYGVVMLGSKRGSNLLVGVILRTLGPSLGELLMSLPAGADIGSMPVQALGKAVSKLSQDLSASDFEHLCNEMAAVTEIQLDNGNFVPLAPKFDQHFAGKYHEMLGWLGFCLEVNYSGFFDEFKKRREEALAAQAAKAKASESQRS